MVRFIALGAACALIFLQVGCVAVASPVAGSIYTHAKGPMDVVDNSVNPVKCGEATATGILGFVDGDASIKAAMQAGGITKIHHVDTEATNVLMVYGKFKTVVWGE